MATGETMGPLYSSTVLKTVSPLAIQGSVVDGNNVVYNTIHNMSMQNERMLTSLVEIFVTGTIVAAYFDQRVAFLTKHLF